MSRSVKKMMEEFFTLLTKHSTINLQDYKSIRLFVTEGEFTAINSGITHLVSVNFGYGHIASLYYYLNNTYMILPACYDAFGTSDGITTFYPNVVRAKKMELGDVHITNFM